MEGASPIAKIVGALLLGVGGNIAFTLVVRLQSDPGLALKFGLTVLAGVLISVLYGFCAAVVAALFFGAHDYPGPNPERFFKVARAIAFTAIAIFILLSVATAWATVGIWL